MENESGDNLSRFMGLSESIVEAVLSMDEGTTARLVQQVHCDFISSIEYNDENSLACTITQIRERAYPKSLHRTVKPNQTAIQI